MAVAIWEGDLGGISSFEIHGVPTRLRERADCCEFGETADEEISLLGDWKVLVQSITKKTVGKMKGPDS